MAMMYSPNAHNDLVVTLKDPEGEPVVIHATSTITMPCAITAMEKLGTIISPKLGIIAAEIVLNNDQVFDCYTVRTSGLASAFDVGSPHQTDKDMSCSMLISAQKSFFATWSLAGEGEHVFLFSPSEPSKRYEIVSIKGSTVDTNDAETDNFASARMASTSIAHRTTL